VADDAGADWDRLVLVGVVARTHGIRGEIVVNPATDFADERFQPGARLFIWRTNATPEPLDVTGVRFHQGRPLLTIRGVDSIDAAEKYAAAEIRIRPEDQGTLPAGVYFHSDLVGCEVVTASGDVVGEVTNVQGEGAASRLVVTSRRGEVLIPLAEEICQVDVPGRRITVTPPEGLLEVNGEWR
jgi:16S rRNA processing protein RimM